MLYGVFSLPSVAALVVGLWFGWPAGASEPASPITVRWEGPPACGSETFAADLEGLLADSEMSAPVRVEVRVVHGSSGWVLQADFSSGGEGWGHRTFEAETCETVRAAAALAIALTIDPAALSAAEPQASPSAPRPDPQPPTSEPLGVALPPADPPATAAAPSPPPTRPPEPAARESGPSSPPWRGAAGVWGFVDGLALPGAGAGVSVVGAAMRGPLRLELQGSYRFATRRASDLDPAVGGSFAQWTMGARGLWVPRWSRVEVPMGGGVDAGETMGEGVGFAGAGKTRQPWLAAVGTAGVGVVVVRRLAVVARGSLAVPLIRPEFTIDGLGRLHQVGPVQLRGVLGVEVRLP